MVPAFDEDGIRVFQGDTIEVMRGLPDKSVHCCVSSPPYYALRDYGTGLWEGGLPGCVHVAVDPLKRVGRDWDATAGVSVVGREYGVPPCRAICAKCGAVRIDKQIGLEPTVAEYLAKMVEVYAEVYRVLRDDGTAWVNIGDSYVAAPNGRSAKDTKAAGKDDRTFRDKPKADMTLKPKNLYLIPQRMAIAFQEFGWYVRSIIIWSKPNSMPESVEDRPAVSHEYVLMLSKSARYYYDADAAREPRVSTQNTCGKNSRANVDRVPKANLKQDMLEKGTYTGFNERWENNETDTRNLRTVWTITPKPYLEAHFATYPPELIRPMIRAGSSAKGCCPTCGAGWVRVSEVSGGTIGKGWHDHSADAEKGQQAKYSGGIGGEGKRNGYRREVKGWKPGCKCGHTETVPAVILDPFFGSGTTGLVARQEGRHAIGAELNPEYICLMRKRLSVNQGLFAEEEDTQPNQTSLFGDE